MTMPECGRFVPLLSSNGNLIGFGIDVAVATSPKKRWRRRRLRSNFTAGQDRDAVDLGDRLANRLGSEAIYRCSREGPGLNGRSGEGMSVCLAGAH